MEFFTSKTKEQSETESQCLSINEKKERILVDTSRVNVSYVNNVLLEYIF